MKNKPWDNAKEELSTWKDGKGNDSSMGKVGMPKGQEASTRIIVPYLR